MRHLTCGISSLHSVNLILFTLLLVHLILCISPHHSHHLHSHHLSLPRSLVSSTQEASTSISTSTWHANTSTSTSNRKLYLRTDQEPVPVSSTTRLLPRSFTPDLKLISFTNSFLYSLYDSFRTASTA